MLDAFSLSNILCIFSFRNGSLVNFLAKELVCGDIVVIATGDRVPADIRLVEVSCFSLDCF